MGKNAPDDAAVGELFRRHGPLVYRRALRLLGRKEDAEEATQEVFIRVLRNMDSFERRSGITTWLYQITTNYCLNQIRDRGRRRVLFQEHVTRNEEERPKTLDPSDLVLLRGLLSLADEDQARAAIYVHFDGMSQDEAAELLGVSRRTVGNLLERFEKWAKKHLEKEYLPQSPSPGVQDQKGSAKPAFGTKSS